MSVKGPSRKRQTGTLVRPGLRPENIELFLDQQYIVDGWDDITADLATGKVAGANVPTWTSFRDGLYAYAFSATTMNEIFVVFHIKHDYADGTKVYPHVHWSPGVSTATGTVRWGFEYSVAKGHQQEAFPASTTVYVEDTLSVADQYGHRITEVTDAQAFNAFEADTLIMMRVFRDAANDTFSDVAFGLTADVHFQTDRQSTPNRSPPFTAR